jgi:hypothetical protein
MRFAGYYGIGVGALILAQWAFFLAAGEVPEVRTAPWEIGLHLAAECLTAAGLLVAGIGLLRAQLWAGPLYLVASGMLLYSVIASPGYFAQRGQWGFVAMFAGLLVLGVVAALMIARATRT